MHETSICLPVYLFSHILPMHKLHKCKALARNDLYDTTYDTARLT